MNLKLHILATVAFLVLIFGALTIFNAINRPSAGPTPITEDRFIQIKSATWGENCDPFLENKRSDMIRKHSSEPLSEPIRKDNALRLVSSLCNGKERCQVTLTEKAMQYDPAPNCAKNMEIEFRCFLTDTAHKARADYSDALTIDCTRPPE